MTNDSQWTSIFGGGGGSSGETKIAEGIGDAENHCFVLYNAFAEQVGVKVPSSPSPPNDSMAYANPIKLLSAFSVS